MCTVKKRPSMQRKRDNSPLYQGLILANFVYFYFGKRPYHLYLCLCIWDLSMPAKYILAYSSLKIRGKCWQIISVTTLWNSSSENWVEKVRLFKTPLGVMCTMSTHSIHRGHHVSFKFFTYKYSKEGLSC